jgi:hypothetical protein
VSRGTIRRDEPRERGLPSLNEARLERRRAIVFGRARLPALPPYFWLWVGVGLAGFAVVYWRIVQGELESRRSAVMAKQRAVAKTLGVRLLPFRDRVERWTIEAAGPYAGNLVASGAALAEIERAPGVYLRLRRANAKSPEAIRKAAQASLRDGFTSCLFMAATDAASAPNQNCRSTAECHPGLLCNEYRVCARPNQPYNLRLAYRALRVLSSEWTDELRQASSQLAISAYDRDLDAVSRSDVPVAIELLSRARYFSLVLDEDPESGSAPELPDAGETPEERVQRSAHPARVSIWDLKTEQLMVRFRGVAAGRFMTVGQRVAGARSPLPAEQRQANSCALALQVKDEIVRAQSSATRNQDQHDSQR